MPPNSSSFTPLPFTIPVDSEAKSHARRKANDRTGSAGQPTRRTIRHYGFRRETEDDLEDRVLTTKHCPRQPSIILLTMCPICREYMLEGSYAAGHCTRCGSPHPLPPGLPL